MTDGLSHIDHRGRARMVDVAEKAVTTRTAQAVGQVRTGATAAVQAGTVAKGDVLAAARIAGIMATKRTHELIPMCHPIAVHGVTVDVEPDPEEDVVRIRATVRTADRTGVEMEALTAVSVAALTLVDMFKGIDKGVEIEDIRLEEKTGGKSGTWRRSG